MNCKQPDRDVPGIECGYPLPCPWHTVTVDLSDTVPAVTIPVTAKLKIKTEGKLLEVIDVLAANKASTGRQAGKRSKRTSKSARRQ